MEDNFGIKMENNTGQPKTTKIGTSMKQKHITIIAVIAWLKQQPGGNELASKFLIETAVDEEPLHEWKDNYNKGYIK